MKQEDKDVFQQQIESARRKTHRKSTLLAKHVGKVHHHSFVFFCTALAYDNNKHSSFSDAKNHLAK